MKKSPLDKKISEKHQPKAHRTAIRVPTNTWKDLTALTRSTGLTINAVVNTAIQGLIEKESHRLGRVA